MPESANDFDADLNQRDPEPVDLQGANDVNMPISSEPVIQNQNSDDLSARAQTLNSSTAALVPNSGNEPIIEPAIEDDSVPIPAPSSQNRFQQEQALKQEADLVIPSS